MRFSRLSDLKRSEFFEIGRSDAAYLKLLTREVSWREKGKGKKLFLFSVLPAIFAQSCAQGVTDLWPANRLFLNARKMHSLPFERSREKRRERTVFYYTLMRKKEI